MLLGLAAIPFIYYLIAIYSSWRYFRKPVPEPDASFAPPASILKPIRGLDPDAFENLASFCRLDYPEFEMVYCVDPDDAAVHAVLRKLKAAFPGCTIRVLEGSGRVATNDKVAKLARLVNEAAYDVVVISDSDVRVQPDYLRRITAPLRDPAVGAVTCFYVPTDTASLTDHLQSVGMMSDFYAGVLVDRQLEGIKFTLGPTIATTRGHLAKFGGYAELENRPADDFLVGKLIAEQGYQIEFLNYSIRTVCDYASFRDLLYKRLRWIVVMRHVRPWGHFGLVATQGLFWSLLASLLQPSMAGWFLGTYAVLRLAMTWVIGIHGLRQRGLWREMVLIPVWDAVAFGIWVVSFSRNSIRWRGADYYIRGGRLVPVERD